MTGGERYGGVVGRTWHESTPWWPAPRTPPPGSPNVVFVVLDDVGFSDLGCYGSEIETPNMDRLAAGGLRYTNFHTTALCSPTRSCLLTGRNHHSVGMAVVSNWDTGFPGCRGRVAKSAGTLAEMLRDSGYGTYAVGKWHLTPMDETSPAGPYDQWPLQRGFDRYYGFLDGATNHWVPDLTRDNERIDPPDRPGYHLTEDLVDQSIAFVRDQVSAYPEKPFFLYLCFGTCHSPLHAPRPYIEKYRGAFDDGWDACRERRLVRQLELGVVPPGTELAPRNPGVRAWEELTHDEQRFCVRLQEAYAGMLDHTDKQLGRLVAFLDEVGKYDDTLIVLLSDNGATLEGGALGSVNYMRWVNGLPMGDLDEALARLDEIGGPTTFPVYPMGWGMAGNTPLKRYKQNTHGGGIRDPLIISWPARITAGGVRTQYHHVTDIVPTILDVIGIDAPSEINGVAQQPVEGVSMTGTFDDPVAPTAKRVQYFEMLGNRAIWRDGWKAVTYHAPGSDFDDDRWELYHVDADFSECHDVAADHPELLRDLVELWWAEAGGHQVLPLDDRILERFLVPKPRPITGRSEFVYYQGARLPSDATPDVKNVSYSITAEVERSRPDDDGVIVACGDRFSGYALFVKGGKLVHDYNCAGTHYVVTSSRDVPTGSSTLRYEFSKTGTLSGDAALFVDGEHVGERHIPQTLGTHVAATGLCVGRDPLAPVSDAYERPFPFRGTIRRVVVQVGNDRDPVGPTDVID